MKIAFIFIVEKSTTYFSMDYALGNIMLNTMIRSSDRKLKTSLNTIINKEAYFLPGSHLRWMNSKKE